MFSIRRMRREDVADVARLEREVFADAWSERAILETLEQRQAMILLAYEDRRLLGYVILYFVLEEGEIARIAVEESRRRQGVASKMLGELKSLCEDNGVGRLLLDVRESNEGARRFYERQGFARDGIRKNYYSDPTEDGILMSFEFT